MSVCGECKHYLGMGDWDLCCEISHPTLKEKEEGRRFSFGHLCYDNTPACDCFLSKTADVKENTK